MRAKKVTPKGAIRNPVFTKHFRGQSILKLCNDGDERWFELIETEVGVNWQWRCCHCDIYITGLSDSDMEAHYCQVSKKELVRRVENKRVLLER